jgi:hypothetical protein
MTSHDDESPPVDPVAALASALELDLLHRYGPMIGHDDLRQALGYVSTDAFRQALSRDQVPVPVFPVPYRRGKYALSKDVAHWLARLRTGARVPSAAGGFSQTMQPHPAPKGEHDDLTD